MTPAEKRKLEALVMKMNKNFEGLVEAMVKINTGAAECEKAMQFLTKALNATHQRARVLCNGVGSFSLDAEIEPMGPVPTTGFVVTGAQTLPPAPTPHPTTGHRHFDSSHPATGIPAPRPRPEGRLVGTKEPVFTVDTPPARPKKEDPSEVPDKSGMIADFGFLDE